MQNPKLFIVNKNISLYSFQKKFFLLKNLKKKFSRKIFYAYQEKSKFKFEPKLCLFCEKCVVMLYACLKDKFETRGNELLSLTPAVQASGKLSRRMI